MHRRQTGGERKDPRWDSPSSFLSLFRSGFSYICICWFEQRVGMTRWRGRRGAGGRKSSLILDMKKTGSQVHEAGCRIWVVMLGKVLQNARRPSTSATNNRKKEKKKKEGSQKRLQYQTRPLSRGDLPSQGDKKETRTHSSFNVGEK
jgi:hypothetical protein